MEIGGYDTLIRTTDTKTTCQNIMALIDWPDAVIEKEDDDEENDNFFWYKNQESKNSWDIDIGPDNTMIYFLFDDNQLTLVTDKELTDIIKKEYNESLIRFDR